MSIVFYILQHAPAPTVLFCIIRRICSAWPRNVVARHMLNGSEKDVGTDLARKIPLRAESQTGAAIVRTQRR